MGRELESKLNAMAEAYANSEKMLAETTETLTGQVNMLKSELNQSQEMLEATKHAAAQDQDALEKKFATAIDSWAATEAKLQVQLQQTEVEVQTRKQQAQEMEEKLDNFKKHAGVGAAHTFGLWSHLLVVRLFTAVCLRRACSLFFPLVFYSGHI